MYNAQTYLSGFGEQAGNRFRKKCGGEVGSAAMTPECKIQAYFCNSPSAASTSSLCFAGSTSV